MSGLFKLSINDLLKGLLVTVISAILTAGINALQTGTLDYKEILSVALIAGASYIVKNLATDDNGKLVGKYQITYKK